MDEQKKRIRIDPQLRGYAQSIAMILISAGWLGLVSTGRPEREWVSARIAVFSAVMILGMIARWVLRYNELDCATFNLSPRVRAILNIGSGAAMVGSLLFAVYLLVTNYDTK